VLGPDHPDTLITWHRMARVLAVRGEHAKAEAEFRDVLAAKSRALGREHPDTLVTRHDIAMIMVMRGDYAGAEAEFPAALATILRSLEPRPAIHDGDCPLCSILKPSQS
jgi:Tetratricopeptide repeat